MRLPLAQLELTRTGRNKNTYRLRLVVPAFCAAVMWAVWDLLEPHGPGPDPEDMASFSCSLISYAVYAFQLFIAFIYTPLLTSGAIAREKQERTLPLLLLTGVRGTDVLAAKGLTVFLQAELLILGCLPLQAINSFFGGLTLEMMLGQQIALMALCVFLTSLGLLCSCLSSRPMDALAITFAGEAVWLLLGAFVDATLLKPLGWGGVYAIRTINDTFQPSYSWPNTYCFAALSIVLAALFLACGRRVLRWTTHTRGSRQIVQHRDFASNALFSHIPWLRLDPAGRLYAANVSAAGGVIYRWPWWLGVLLAGCVFGVPGATNFWPVIVTLIFYDVSSSLASVQADGSMELLFVTSTDDSGIARAIHRTHLRRACLFVPPLFLANVLSLGLGQLQSPAGQPDSALLGVQYVAIGGLGLIETWVEASAYVSLACVCVARYGHIVRQGLYAVAWLLGLHVLTSILSTMASIAIVFTLEATVDNNFVQSYVLAPGNAVAKTVYFAVLVGMSRGWRNTFLHAIKVRWRGGEPLAEDRVSRFLTRPMEPA